MLCTVLRGTRQLATPHPHARPGEAVKIVDLFTKRFDYDAFVLAHAIPEGELPYRVTKEDYLTRFPGLRFVLLFADLDAHELPVEALAEWKAAELERARVLFRTYPGLLYPTSRGLRLAWRVDLTFREYGHLAQTFYRALSDHGFPKAERGRPGLDFSACTFGRHMRLPLVRRDGKDQSPIVEGSLDSLRFDPGPLPAEAPKRFRPRRNAFSAPGFTPNDPIVRRALELETAIPLHGGKFAVICPGGPHSGGAITSKSAVLPDGRYVCQSDGCISLRYADWAATVPFELSTLEAAEARIEEIIRKGDVAQELHVVDVPCGVGKSHIARKFLPPGAIISGVPTVLLSPTNALATQHREACGAEQHAGVAAVVPGREECKQPKAIAKLHELGLSSKYACQTCPNREGCKVAKPIGSKALGIVSTHAMLHRFNEGKHLVIVDEMPHATESFEIELAAIAPALAACKREWATGVGAWGSALIDMRVDERARERAQQESETPETHKMPTYDEHFDAKRMAETFAPILVAQAVRRAAHPSAKITFAEGKARVVRLGEVMAYLQTRGGILLAAGASESVVRAIRPDADVTHVYVQDPPGVAISRVLVKTSYATTRALVADQPRLARIVQSAISRAEGRPTLIMCAKALETRVRGLAPGAAVAHYGALRGLDAWKDRDVFVTIGDHFDNILAVDAEAEFLNVDGSTLSRERVEIELGQAHGRARDPRRSKAALHLHFGEVWPAGWGPAKASVEF